MGALIDFRGDAMMSHTCACARFLALSSSVVVAGCGAGLPLPRAVGNTEGPPIGLYRTTLLQCAGQPDRQHPRDDTETLVFGACTVHLVAGYVQRLEGTCVRLAHCR